MMKTIKWKILVITCLVCLASVLPGILMWKQLPDTMAIHFDINNNPDGFASKGFAVFGFPLMMVALQIICCVINDVNARKHGERKKFERVTKWILPCMAIILQTLTVAFSLGMDIDVRKCAALIVGVIFLAIGNYLPKFDYIKNADVDTSKARRINRFIGIETVIMGVLFIVSIFLPSVVSLVCLWLLIPYAIIAIIYSVVICRK